MKLTVSLIAVLSFLFMASSVFSETGLLTTKAASVEDLTLEMKLRAALSEGETGTEPAYQGAPAKSRKLAFLLSAVVPGAGEIYAGAWRGLAFSGLEVGLWTMWASWRGKGNDIEKDYEAFADEHWNEGEYRVWEATRDTSRLTHRLPDTKTQQYYEMIGKYEQFVRGWDDVLALSDSTGQSENRDKYMDMRYDSDTYLKRAGYAAGFILLNHIISAIDASIATRQSSEAEAARERTSVHFALTGKRDTPMLFLSRRF